MLFKIICFSSEAASRKLAGRSWLAGVAKALNVEMQIIELPTEIREQVIEAQSRQKMVNNI